MHSTGDPSASPLVVILGPTAVGKTALAITMAQALDGAIVSADSRQIYRQMDIGTAKPTPEQREQAEHHLIDVVDPDETLSLAQYQRLAYAAIDEIHRRGGIPLLVGGTGQYITSIIEGWSIPEVPPNAALRAELERFSAEQGVEALFARLIALDPGAADVIDPRNPRRLIRAIEITLDSGTPYSEQRRKRPPPYRVIVYGLTLDRARLYERADSRVDEMMEQGFLDEVRGLLDKGYRRELPSMSGLGYAALAAHLIDGLPLEDAVAATKNATHDFIRRQFTWFRGHDHAIMWHNVDELAPAALIDATAAWLGR